VTDHSTNQTTAGEPGRNAPREVTSQVRAVVLGGQENRGVDPGTSYRADPGAQNLAISLIFVGRAAGNHSHGCRSHQVQT
jgi:hypothetical protein